VDREQTIPPIQIHRYRSAARRMVQSVIQKIVYGLAQTRGSSANRASRLVSSEALPSAAISSSRVLERRRARSSSALRLRGGCGVHHQ
jgi:hypothetical protein